MLQGAKAGWDKTLCGKCFERQGEARIFQLGLLDVYQMGRAEISRTSILVCIRTEWAVKLWSLEVFWHADIYFHPKSWNNEIWNIMFCVFSYLFFFFEWTILNEQFHVNMLLKRLLWLHLLIMLHHVMRVLTQIPCAQILFILRFSGWITFLFRTGCTVSWSKEWLQRIIASVSGSATPMTSPMTMMPLHLKPSDKDDNLLLILATKTVFFRRKFYLQKIKTNFWCFTQVWQKG